MQREALSSLLSGGPHAPTQHQNQIPPAPGRAPYAGGPAGIYPAHLGWPSCDPSWARAVPRPFAITSTARSCWQTATPAAQVFTYDKALYTIGLEFYLPGAQPQGELEVVLSDADTGEELARSTGVMQNIIPDQYTTLGLDPVVPAQEGRRYQLSVTAHYTSDAVLASATATASLSGKSR